MDGEENARAAIDRKLCDSIEQLHQAADKVELWAQLVAGFTQPIPEYDLTNPKAKDCFYRALYPENRSS